MKKLLCIALCAALLGGCGYNRFQALDEQITAAQSEILNQYQRRADLIPNIVATVKAQADFEKSTLEAVIASRNKALSLNMTPEMMNDPAALKKFQQTQSELGGALSRLIAVAEQYPQLQANQGFHDLRVTLEGTENRITVARNGYIQAVKEYNVLVRQFPTNFTAKYFDYQTKANFTVENEAALAKPPTVDFGSFGHQPGAVPAPTASQP